MIDRKAIFKKAWEIKKEDSRNLFSLCLRMAWAEAKQMKTESREEKIERLSKKYSRWTKAGYDRIYFNATKLGLEYDTYNTGNLKWVTIDDQVISNCKGRRILNDKAYWDLNTDKLYIGETMEVYFGDKIRAEVGR
jgi:hypothetical protein